MKSVFQPLALALVLAASGFSAFAAGPGEGPAGLGEGMAMQDGMSHHGTSRMDPAKMQARMNKHGDATKALYATLTPEQQKVFDAHSMGRHAREGHMGNLH